MNPVNFKFCFYLHPSDSNIFGSSSSIPGDVPHDEGEGVLGGGAEVGALDGAHDVGVAVDEAHEALEAPQAALAAAQQAAGHLVVVTVQKLKRHR